jgi:ubiquinone/menaquinone biosynthesis C-methylase UbiE
MSDNRAIELRGQAIERHNLDSGIFQGRYSDFTQGRFTDEFIYGRYQIFEEVDAELGRIPAHGKVLDLGCGTGHFSNYILHKGFIVEAIDPSLKMLEFAGTNFPNIKFIEGVASSLPFPDHSFDLVISIEVLRYLDVSDVKLAYKEMHRVLKPGGRILITHVNKYAADGYYFFYYIKQFFLKIAGRPLHACYFTTPAAEIKLASREGFSMVKATGRMFASIRIAYKFGKTIGRLYSRLLEQISRNQKFYSGVSRTVAGHLVITASK